MSEADETIFAERCFELDGEALVVRVHQPFKAPGGEFACLWTIGWPEGERRSHRRGEDGIQALMLALRRLHIELPVSDAYKAGRLTRFGSTDLDLGSSWFDEPPAPPSPAPGR